MEFHSSESLMVSSSGRSLSPGGQWPCHPYSSSMTLTCVHRLTLLTAANNTVDHNILLDHLSIFLCDCWLFSQVLIIPYWPPSLWFHPFSHALYTSLMAYTKGSTPTPFLFVLYTTDLVGSLTHWASHPMLPLGWQHIGLPTNTWLCAIHT